MLCNEFSPFVALEPQELVWYDTWALHRNRLSHVVSDLYGLITRTTVHVNSVPKERTHSH